MPEGPRALSLECTLAVRRPGWSRVLSALSAAVMLAPIALITLGALLYSLGLVDAGFPSPEVALALLWGFLLGAPSLMILSTITATGGAPKAGELRVNKVGLTVVSRGRTRAVLAVDVVSGLVLPTIAGFAVDLHVRDGRALRVAVEDEHDAHAILDRLGIGPDRRRVAVVLGNPNRPLAAGCVAIPASILLGMMVIIVLPSSLRRSDSDLIPVSFGLFILASTLLARRLARPSEIVIGADGVLLKRSFGTRLLPLAAIDGVESYGGRLVFTLRGKRGVVAGRRVVSGGEAGTAAGIADRVRKALARTRVAVTAAATDELDPRGRPLAEWRAALGKLVQSRAEYRRAALTADDLLAVLEDPGAPPPRRLGAALALRVSEHPEARARARIAADTCVDEPMRAALEALAEEEINEAKILRALSPRRGRAPEP